MIPYVLPEYINYVSLARMSAGYLQHSCPLVKLVGGGGMVDVTKNDKYSDGTLKRVHTEVSCLLSVLLSKEPGTNITIQKASVGLAGEPKSVLKSQEWLFN